MSALPLAAAPRPQTSRVVFLDLARAAAVLFMIQGHTIHQLLDTAYEPGLGFQAWLYLRGLTSCMFLLLSGFSFSIASDRYWDELRRPSARLLKRINRFLFLLGLGYLIRFPMGKFAHLQFASDERWQSFLQVDILQLVAGTLFLMQVLVMLLARRRRFAQACAVIAALVVAATPLFWTRPLVGTVPLWMASYLSSETGSNFPLFPWAAFMFFGAALGMAWTRRGARWPLSRTAAVFGALGAALLVAGLVMFLLPFRPYGEIDVWRAGPSIFATRLGSVLVLLGGFAYVSRSIPRLPGAVRALSQESLTIYVVHVAVLYGSLWTPGLARSLGRQDLAHTMQWIVILTVSMGALAWAWNQVKRHPPTLTYALRFAIAWALIWPLL